MCGGSARRPTTLCATLLPPGADTAPTARPAARPHAIASISALHWWPAIARFEADALLAGAFEIEGKEALIRRGRMLFPGPLTRHWDE